MMMKRFVTVFCLAMLFSLAAAPQLSAQDACQGCQPTLSAINVTQTFNCSTLLFTVNSGTNNAGSAGGKCRRMGMEWSVVTDGTATIQSSGGQALINFSLPGWQLVCVEFTVALIQSDGNFDLCTVEECIWVNVCP